MVCENPYKVFSGLNPCQSVFSGMHSLVQNLGPFGTASLLPLQSPCMHFACTLHAICVNCAHTVHVLWTHFACILHTFHNSMTIHNSNEVRQLRYFFTLHIFFSNEIYRLYFYPTLAIFLISVISMKVSGLDCRFFCVLQLLKII